MKNNDMQMIRAFLPILQNCYPEVVGRIIIVEYPFIIWGLWKIVKPLLDVRTQNKIQFISADELSDHFNEESIPEEIGGTWEGKQFICGDKILSDAVFPLLKLRNLRWICGKMDSTTRAGEPAKMRLSKTTGYIS